MPFNKIVPTARGKSILAAGLIAASLSGWTAFTGAKNTPAHPEITPAVIHAAIDKNYIPPAVDMAVEALIRPWEGLKTTAYYDKIAKPPVWTVCYGETKNVKAGMSFTPAQCLTMLKKRVIRDYYLPLVDNVKGFASAPYSVQASMTSGAYNFGVGAMKKSKAAGFVGSNEYQKACEAQTAFNKAGGVIIPGLVARRENGDKDRVGEAELCVSGLKK